LQIIYYFQFQKESWGETINQETTRAKGGSARRAAGRTKILLEREANMRKLAESYATLEKEQYMLRMISIQRMEI
jgi:hypothetical protein